MRPRAQAPRRVETTYRIAFLPSAPSRPAWLESAPWWLGLASAALLLLGTVGFPWWQGVVGHAVADYHYWQGKQAYRMSEPQIVVQRHWQRAVAADPGYHRVRLDLARSYLDGEWYGGAIAEAEAVLKGRPTRFEASLAHTYMGYGRYMLGETTLGTADLELAVELDAQNVLAQSVLERLRRQGSLPALPKESK